MPRQVMTAGHLPDRHHVHIFHQLAGQATCHMGSAPQQDLGMVLPMPAGTLSTGESAPHSRQGCRTAPRGEITHLIAAAVVHRRRLEPAIRAADHPADIHDLNHQTFDQIHYNGDHTDTTQVQTNGHNIRTHQPGIATNLRLPNSPRSLRILGRRGV